MKKNEPPLLSKEAEILQFDESPAACFSPSERFVARLERLLEQDRERIVEALRIVSAAGNFIAASEAGAQEEVERA